MQQKLGLCCALMSHPRLLILWGMGANRDHAQVDGAPHLSTAPQILYRPGTGHLSTW